MARGQELALGAGAALAIALPAALLAQVAEAIADGDGPAAATYPLALVVLLGMAVGGWVLGSRRGPDRDAARLGAAAAAMAALVVQGLGVARALIADDDVAWGTVPVVAALAVALGAGGAALGARRAGRTRP